MITLKTTESLDVSAEKLFAPIEELNLERRTFHMLKRVGIKTVSEIVVAGKSNVLTIRNIGPLQTNHIFSVVANYLGISEESLSSVEVQIALPERKKLTNYLGVSEEGLSSVEVKQTVLPEKKKPTNPLSMPVAVLDLPVSIIRLLQKSGVAHVEQLIKFRADNYENNIQFGKTISRKIDRELRLYLNSIDKVGSKQIQVSNQTINLAELFSFWLKERDWLILELRANRLLTLGEIATEIGGISRERVRQIIEPILEKIQRRLYLLNVFLIYFEERANFIRQKLKAESFTINLLVSELKLQLNNSNFVATEKDIEKLISIIRILVLNNKPWANEKTRYGLKDIKGITFLACQAEPPIEKYKEVRKSLEENRIKNKKLTYKEIAYMVLSEAKRPMHWREIAEKAYKLNKRESFQTRALYHVLLAHEELFVRVGQGTYELAEWGSKQVVSYVDIIASLLKDENQSIPIDVILAKVSSVRSVKQSSLIMYLYMHPRFYRSINSTYGLRGWLLPREEQNLRTPEWLIEDSKSFERVERAEQRGYVVESIIAEDKLK